MKLIPPLARGLRGSFRHLVVGTALMATAAGAALTVGTSGFDFTSLQAAINAANPGDVIDVRSTITESGILIGKNITIKSTLAAPQIVQAAATPGTATDRVFYIFGGNQVTMENLVIRHGVFNSGVGGGIVNIGQLTLLRVRVEKNHAGNGAGIFTQGPASSLTLTECTVESNSAIATGGGLYADSSAPTQVQRCTFAKNQAFEGGAIMNRLTANLTVTNSTISMNRSNNGGAGIFNQEGASATVNSCTFSHNSLRAIQSNGATSTFSIRNSIIANSLLPDFETEGEDCATFGGATFTDLGHNLVEHPGSNPFTATGSVTGIDPQLGALADYGGPTRVHIFGVFSPAANTGNGGLGIDQRGFARPTPDDKGSFLFRDAGEQLRPSAFCAPVAAAGEIYFGEFRGLEFRSPNFAVQVQNGAGGFDSFSPDFYSHGTYVGTIDGLPGAIAGGTYFPLTGKLYYHAIFENGKEWDNEGGGTRIRGADPLTATAWAGAAPGAGGAGSNLFAAEVAVDLPSSRFITKHASNANDALAMIEHSMMATNLIYMRQTGIQHRLGRVILRGSAAQDPYVTKTDHDLALTEVTRQWEEVLYTALSPGSHDLAVVVNFEDSGGLAPIGSIGSPQGYSSCATTARGDFSGVFRHEAGHNWNLLHFDGQSPEGPTINSGNQIGRMSGPEQAIAIRFREQQSSFLDNLGPATLPIPPSAATDRAFVPATSSTFPINLLANDHDANGDAITLISFSSASELTLGGTLSATATPGVVQYNRALSGPTTAIDRFRYRIRDASGLEAEGFLFVRLNNIVANGQYTQNFNSFANGTESLGDGSYGGTKNTEGAVPVSVQGQALQITPDTGWQNNTFTLPSPAGLSSGFNLKFRFKMNSAATPADYLAVNFGPENSSRLPSTGLSVEFDSFSRQGYVVRVNNVEVPGGFFSRPGLANNVFHDVDLTWLPGHGVTLTVDGTTAFTNLPVPGLTASADSLVGFSAFTGGFSQSNVVDDVILTGPTKDQDADGIPAIYEALYGLNDLSAADADSDSDGDNFSALFEYRIGTRANSYAHRPLWAISRPDAAHVRLSFGPVVAGKTYFLKSSTDGAFTTFATIVPTIDAPVYARDVPTSEAPAKMFRLEIPAQ